MGAKASRRRRGDRPRLRGARAPRDLSPIVVQRHPKGPVNRHQTDGVGGREPVTERSLSVAASRQQTGGIGGRLASSAPPPRSRGETA